VELTSEQIVTVVLWPYPPVETETQHDPVLVPGVDSTLDDPGVVAVLDPGVVAELEPGVVVELDPGVVAGVDSILEDEPGVVTAVDSLVTIVSVDVNGQ